MTPVVAVLGLGEAGGRIAADLAAAGATVRGFDPRVPAPPGVWAATSDADACAGAGLVLSVNSAHDALDALRQSLPACRPGTLWADLNTAAPGLKEALWQAAGGAVEVVDVALMAPVPGRGLRTPMTISGPAAARVAAQLTAWGARAEVIDGPVGAAARPARRSRASCCAASSTRAWPPRSSSPWRRPAPPAWRTGWPATSARS
jgi:hypothetical protein